jgi:hypothetical protein
MRAAYATFHEAVVEQLQAVLPSPLAAAVIATDQAVNGTAGPLITLEQAVQAATNPSQFVSAYTTYYLAVRAVVQTHMPTATAEQLDAVTEALVLSNLSV